MYEITYIRTGTNTVRILRFTLIHIYYQVLAAIFDFSLSQTLDYIRTSLSGLPDPINMDIAVRILLLSGINQIYRCYIHTSCAWPPF